MEVTISLDRNNKLLFECSYKYKGQLTNLETLVSNTDDQYIVLIFADKNRAIQRYGSFILRFSSKADRLTEKFSARAPEMEGEPNGEMVSGTIELVKTI